MKTTVGQAARFMLVGSVATAIHVVIALALHSFANTKPLPANFFAFLVASGVSYSANRHWTFAAKTTHGTAISRFFAIAVIGLCLNQLIVYSIVEGLRQPFWIALIPVVTLVPAFTFWLNRTHVFDNEL
jgi:putative flippase GtrA